MIKTITLATALATGLAFPAAAQDTKNITPPAATSTPIAAPVAVIGIVMTAQESANWVDKPVYSSDGQKIGEVVVFQRDPGNKVLGMHADIGGFLGMLQTRVNLMPSQFKLQTDRVVISLTAEQAKSLPKVQS